MTVCTRCVLDDSVTKLTFDEKGVCSFCHYLDSRPRVISLDPAERELQFRRVVAMMKSRRRLGSKYDCVIGLSGGIDSSYAALVTMRAGLVPLAVHVDNGWNTEIAVQNIERIVRGLGIDLITYVIDWEEFRGIQLSLLRAGVVDLELPSDHAIFAGMWLAARRHRVRYVVTGENDATESILPEGWNHRKTDLRNIRAINRAYERATMRTFPKLSTVWNIVYRRVLSIQPVGILGYVDYNKERAFHELEHALGYRRYGAKHFESIITRFYQGYILPRKFGIDKRRYHYCLLIHSNQMTRDAALRDLENPPYDPKLAEADKIYVCKKFGITLDEFERIMREPPRPHTAFDSDEWLVSRLFAVVRGARALHARARAVLAGPSPVGASRSAGASAAELGETSGQRPAVEHGHQHRDERRQDESVRK